MYRNSKAVWLGILALGLIACSESKTVEDKGAATETTSVSENKPKLGLMTSLPLYWSLETDLADIAQGNGQEPWQRLVLEHEHELVPLDTLSPIPALSPDEPETDPLAGLERLAVIQPRGLTPADNAALDEWVRGGGHLLLVLDPMLSGEYEAPIGDPRRPVDAALIPPFVRRLGLEISFDEEQEEQQSVPFNGSFLTVSLAGQIVQADDFQSSDARCVIEGIAARCSLGKGSATVLADAFHFEYLVEPTMTAPSGKSGIAGFLHYAFQE